MTRLLAWVQGRVARRMVHGEIEREEVAHGEKVRILAALGLPADHTPQKKGPQQPV